MAGNVNKVFLMGNLTRDIEIRQAGASNVANVGLAINRNFKTSSGETREETTFVDCEAWGRTAEVMARYLNKGRPVFVEGRLKLDQWQDQQGNNRSKLKVVIENFQFVDSPGGGGGGGGGGGSHGNAGGGNDYNSGQSKGNYQPVTDDEIPF
jgi:single-strand DNA-binding protein